MKVVFHRLKKYLVIFAILFCLTSISAMTTGCSALNPSASMRVDIEVYKGPLSKPVEIQIAELEGLVSEARKSLENYQFNLTYLACQEYNKYFSCCENAGKNKDNFPHWPTSVSHAMQRPDQVLCVNLCQYSKTLIDSITLPTIDKDIRQSLDRIKDLIEACKGATNRNKKILYTEIIKASESIEENLTLLKSHTDARHPDIEIYQTKISNVLSKIKALPGNSSITKEQMEEISAALAFRETDKERRQWLKQVARSASIFKAKGATIAGSFLPLVTDKNALRTVQALLAVIASEYGNQMGHRASVLLAQMNNEKKEDMPLSAYLSDSGCTEASNLYDWYRAKAPFMVEEWKGFLPVTILDSTSRVRSFERIYNDNYWSKINTVYASGTGDVSMALIRDEYGNWNLKNFSNDPTELLKAYNDLGRASLKAAIKTIKNASSSGTTTALAEAAQLANAFAFNGATDSEGIVAQRIELWHENLIKELDEFKTAKSDTQCDEDCKIEIKRILERYENKLDVLREIYLTTQQQASTPTNKDEKKETPQI
jgi:hypothetical protein